MNIDYCYRVFNLPRSASKEEIYKRYKELYDIYNPKSPYANEQRYREIIEAYWTIRSYLKKVEEQPTKFVVEKKSTAKRATRPLVFKGGLVLAGVAAGAVVLFSGIAIKNNISANYIKEYTDKNVPVETASQSQETHYVVPPIKETPVLNTEEIPRDPTDSDHLLTENGFSIETIDGVTYIDGQIIVNKTYSLPRDYTPKNPLKTISEERGVDYLEKEVLEAFYEMRNDAAKSGLNLWIASGYRSYDYQSDLHDKYVRANGEEIADSFSARPGYSEHQTGLSFDLNSVSLSFANTREGLWVAENCYKYGFIIRYPKGKDDQTGYTYEPWHLRFVGKELASLLYNDGDWTTMEEYYGIKSEYINSEELGKGLNK